jgi:uncharacterized protein YbjT (DUF2867 family)
MSSKILVVGSTGNVGTATLKYLANHLIGREHKLFAGVRDVKSDKAQELAKLPGVTVVNADMSQPATLASALQGVDAAFLVTPGDQKRKELTCAAIDAAKEAKVKHIVVVSVSTAEVESIFGTTQTLPIETHTKASGVPYTILRLPIFIDNNWGNKGSIQGQGVFYGPQKGDAPFTPIAVQDIGEAAAIILANPASHVNQTYNLTTKAYTNNQLATAFSLVLNKEVKYVQVPYEAAKKSFMDHGYPEWQVDGIMELFKLIDAENKAINHESADFKKITSRNPTTMQQWVAQVAGVFGREKKIGILGTGDVGKSLAAGLVKHGYDVLLGARDAKSEKLAKLATEIKGLKTGSFKDATAHGHTVIMALGFAYVEEAIKLAGGADAFKGKLVIDPTNPIKGIGAAGVEFSVGFNSSAGEKIQGWLEKSSVVKGWNVIGNAFFIDPPADKHGVKPNMWICGNDEGALCAEKLLLNDLGWSNEQIIVGPGGILASRWMEPFCQAWVNYGFATGTWRHGLAMLHF